ESRGRRLGCLRRWTIGARCDHSSSVRSPTWWLSPRLKSGRTTSSNPRGWARRSPWSTAGCRSDRCVVTCSRMHSSNVSPSVLGGLCLNLDLSAGISNRECLNFQCWFDHFEIEVKKPRREHPGPTHLVGLGKSVRQSTNDLVHEGRL